MKTSQAKKRVTIVTVLHNSSAVIGECLKSIPDGVPVFVVDNASNDNSIAVARAARPDAIILQSDMNLGFGRANNLALEKVETEYAFALNPDTLLKPDTIDNLLNVADKYSDSAIVAPTMYYTNGEIQKTYKNSIFAKENSFDSYTQPTGDACVEWLLGAALMLRMKAFKESGFFDPNIFLFYEDDDLCMNTRKNGYSIIITPNASMVHLSAKSSPATYKYIYRKSWHMMWSRLYLEKKYHGDIAAFNMAKKYRLKNIMKVIKYILFFRKKKLVMHFAELRASFAFLNGKGAFGE